jgi:hypothetical protein
LDVTLRNLLSIYFVLATLAPAGRYLARESSAMQSPADTPPVQQSASSSNDDAAAKAAVRKKRFDEIRHRLESGEGGLDSYSGDSEDSSPMRIVYLTPYLGTDRSNRVTTDSLRVDYELDQDFLQGFLEVVSAGSVTARYPLPALARGRHSMNIPRGIPLANDPYTFTCNLPESRYGGITQRVDFLWDNRNMDSINPQFPMEDDASIYNYQPPPPPEDRDVDPSDSAAAFRGDEVAITSSNIPHKRNRMRLSTGRSPEIQILGVNFSDGDEVVCTKESYGNPPIEATTRLHDVRTVSTISHQQNDAIPELRAGRFDVPERIAAHGTFVRLVGEPR